MKRETRIKIVPAAPVKSVLVNAGESRSVVGSENNLIARAISVMSSSGVRHAGRITVDQAISILKDKGVL